MIAKQLMIYLEIRPAIMCNNAVGYGRADGPTGARSWAGAGLPGGKRDQRSRCEEPFAAALLCRPRAII
jgi:hypothetical protein